MPSFEINEFVVLVIFSISFLILTYYILKSKRRPNAFFWGFAFLFMNSVFTNLEAFMYPDILNILEHFSVVPAGLLFAMAAYQNYQSIRETARNVRGLTRKR